MASNFKQVALHLTTLNQMEEVPVYGNEPRVKAG